MSAPRTFTQDLRAGQAVEARVSSWLTRQGFTAVRASLEDQRRGIDLWVQIRPPVGAPAKVEVKTQLRPAAAFFLETHGGDLAQQGWAFTSESQLFAFVEEPTGLVLLVRPEDLRSRIGGWLDRYTLVQSPVTDGSRRRGRGVLVPWHELDAVALGLWWLTGPAPDPVWLLAKLAPADRGNGGR